MNGPRVAQRVKVTGDGKGVASHAGLSLVATVAKWRDGAIAEEYIRP